VATDVRNVASPSNKPGRVIPVIEVMRGAYHCAADALLVGERRVGRPEGPVRDKVACFDPPLGEAPTVLAAKQSVGISIDLLERPRSASQSFVKDDLADRLSVIVVDGDKRVAAQMELSVAVAT
jgi:hypothetical protein